MAWFVMSEELKKITEIKTFAVPFALAEIKENIFNTDTLSKIPKEKIINQAFNFHSQGKIQEASKYYQYAISNDFNDSRIFSNYGVLLKNLGNLKEAELYTRQAIELDPDFADAYNNLGSILQALGRLKEAELYTRQAIKLDTDDAISFFNLGNILKSLGNLKEAELYTRQAIELNPDFAEAYSNLGIILNDIGKIEESQVLQLKAIELNPDLVNAYFNLFQNYEQTNNLGKLKESLKKFRNIDIIENERLLFDARLSFRNKEYKIAKKLIDSISNRWLEKINNDEKIIFWSFKAFIEDKLENHQLAYSCFVKSQENALYDRFSKDSYLNYINSYKNNVISKENRFNILNDGIEDSNLSFLIGFPRSGTTLLDTILRSHESIEVIEEKPLFQVIERIVREDFDTRLDNIYSLSENNINILRNKYFELLNKYTNQKGKIVIDKIPLHTARLPMINLLFPNSKIIFSHRHPYDTVLSCFQQTFKPNVAMKNFVSLESSSRMYDQVMCAWNIYKNNLPICFITSKYEDLIIDFENHILKILDFLGVGWDENIKNYRQTAKGRGKINTPSSSQVIEPLYKSSIEKWKNYEEYFEGCHNYLEKWVGYFNY